MSSAAIGFLFGAILLEVIGQVCFKLGVAQERRYWGIVNRWIAFGITAYLLELTLWLAVLSTSQLSQVFPLLTLSYIGVALASRLLFREVLHPRMILGLCLITAGAAIVLRSS